MGQDYWWMLRILSPYPWEIIPEQFDLVIVMVGQVAQLRPVIEHGLQRRLGVVLGRPVAC